MHTCDIIIPTHNNAGVLLLVLRALQQQHIPDHWSVKILISDDGSTDNTIKVIRNLKTEQNTTRSEPLKEVGEHYGLPITVIKGKHTGQAGARNRAIEKSNADVLFFLGADIILRPNVLARHCMWHGNNPHIKHAVLGAVRWDPRVHPTPFMEWMIHGGQQNAFDDLLGKSSAEPQHFFYGSHVSVRREVLGETRFPSDYQTYGWEDLDVGRQLLRRGVGLTNLHQAIALHHHHYSTRGLLSRQYCTGQNIHKYQRRFMGENIAPQLTMKRSIKLWIYRFSGIRFIIHTLMELYENTLNMPWLFSIVTAAEFWYGYLNKSPKKAI